MVIKETITPDRVKMFKNCQSCSCKIRTEKNTKRKKRLILLDSAAKEITCIRFFDSDANTVL